MAGRIAGSMPNTGPDKGSLDALIAHLLSAVFTAALFYATLELPRVVNRLLKETLFPDLAAMGRWSEVKAFTEAVTPLGYACLTATLALIILGFAIGRIRLSVLGSLTAILPVFGYFAASMFFLAGIGILRVLWLPLLKAPRPFSTLGSIIYLPYKASAAVWAPLVTATGGAVLTLTALAMLAMAVIGLLLRGRLKLLGRVLTAIATVALASIAVLAVLPLVMLGLAIFSAGAAAWLYGRVKGHSLVDFWIYRYSRHPQYLGYLTWSYGLTLLASMTPAPRGGCVPLPGLPWLLSALSIIGVALWEEAAMAEKHGVKYTEYRRRTCFMLPLSRQLARILTAPARALLRKEYPENGKEIAVVLLLYGAPLALAPI